MGLNVMILRKDNLTTPLPKELYCYLNKFYQSGCHYIDGNIF